MLVLEYDPKKSNLEGRAQGGNVQAGNLSALLTYKLFLLLQNALQHPSFNMSGADPYLKAEYCCSHICFGLDIMPPRWYMP